MSFEADTESTPLTPEQEQSMLALALDRAASEVAEAMKANTQDELFYALPGAAIAAYRLGEHHQARAFAQQALDLALFYKKNWNYGNAIHFGHVTYGLLALDDGNLEAAIAELLKAGETEGSPQLNSFGPTMQLARELAKLEQFEPVLEYLSRCRTFWVMGSTWLDLWETKLRNRAVPNFAMNLYR